MNKVPKNLFLLIAIVLGVVILFTFSAENRKGREINFSQFMDIVENGQMSEVVIKGTQINGRSANQETFITSMPKYYTELPRLLYKRGIHFRFESDGSNNLFFAILSSWLPIILIIGVWVFFMKQMQGGNKIMGFGKSQHHKVDEDAKKYTFDDVAGIDESKAELDEIVEFLKDPSKFEKLGGKIPTGVLLVGEPGTGKTLLAKAIAGEAQVAFFNISGSDFVEMFVGVGASRVRDLFAQARENAPGIVFIDEIDAVGRHRGAGLGGGNDEREQTLNQLLVEMDGFNGNEGVIVIAATNRPDVLDSALTRPGRFDRQVVVPRPDMNGRQKILTIHTRDLKLSENVDLKVIAQATPGFTGADLANLANESALTAARQNKSTIEMDDFEKSRDKVMMGKERRSMVIPEEEKKTTAYHEAGHAIIAALLKEVDPVHKVTIIPRGRALGLTMLLPVDDKHSQKESQLRGMLVMMMGGRAAEEIVFSHFTTGASNDLERAASFANRMVCNWGMSKTMGPVHLGANQGEVFLGRDIMRKKNISQKSANSIDQEVNKIVNEAYQIAMDLLNENIDSLHAVTQELIEMETISGEDIINIVEKSRPLDGERA
ncbi:MAG: ATP-dependent metallopeptidase FtsH/Yme1/Tma family protein [Deltaproteobacteria bacterium]|jgi:cell division protease FtsH|nr:ATP-dependent metallopeptidase FtsH/Yme1/Tma family protein [Deltaproteobacteria bacterium]MBT4269123.1 ATP-dependent metallopeptidase FtsH/Yme1/Tma family protein [Deltaproteobacteria bacterium]MBT4641298.1 ATP-dependent metallopeptidase FtsH/Yme1/Tma family protein [Deltaproteobacteria bacterium]MBT6504268.1 ATP-dependent metallopeptidase FtsH/Yme1/Tma family protein [Deltaproteobacteria bacterium]MBT6611004.1 ATP-dependent metallopeptidase FtsH/Yme1/Tma family protein [Deltaproteobacteria